MNLIISIIDIANLILFFLSLGILWTLLRGTIIAIIKKDSSELKDDYMALEKLARQNVFKYTIMFIMFILITIVSSREITFYIGFKDLRYISDGTYTYYVNLEKISTGKTYFEPAVITKRSDCLEEKACNSQVYTLEKVYFANGGYITFDDVNEVKIGKKTYVVDHKGIEYNVELLNRHAYIEKVKETTPSIINIIIVIYMLSIELICWLLPLYRISQKNKKENNKNKKSENDNMIIDNKNNKIERIIEILEQDSKKLYEINKKYSFAKSTMVDDYNAFSMTTSIFMNYQYMNACKEVYEDEEKVNNTFETALNTKLSKLAMNEDHLNLLKGIASTCYEYSEEKQKEFVEMTEVGTKDYYDLIACEYIAGVNDPDKMGEYFETDEFNQFKDEVSEYIKNALDKLINEDLV